jgi:hypothetical protein
MSDQGLSGGHLVLPSAGEENIALFQCRSQRQKREYILLANIENLATECSTKFNAEQYVPSLVESEKGSTLGTKGCLGC